MLGIESVNHIGIRISDKATSIAFYQALGFDLKADAGYDERHPVIMKHPSGVVLNLLGPAIFIRDPDRNVIELDAFAAGESNHDGDYADHP